MIESEKNELRIFARVSTISENYRRSAVTVKLRRFGRTGQIVNGENHFIVQPYALIVMYKLIFASLSRFFFFIFFSYKTVHNI